MGRRPVAIKVVLLDVLAVVTLAVRQAEEPLLEDEILAVPEGQRKAEELPVVGDPPEPALAPAVGPRPGLVVPEVLPRVPRGAVVLTHRPWGQGRRVPPAGG